MRYSTVSEARNHDKKTYSKSKLKIIIIVLVDCTFVVLLSFQNATANATENSIKSAGQFEKTVLLQIVTTA